MQPVNDFEYYICLFKIVAMYEKKNVHQNLVLKK